MIQRLFHIRILVLTAILLYGCSNADDDGSSSSVNINSVSTFGGSNNERGESVVATLDGGFAILGFTQSNDGNITDKSDESFDFWVSKYTRQNTMEWSYTFGGSGNDRGRELIQTSDGGFALLGSSSSSDGDASSNAGQLDFWLLRLTSSGQLLWEESYGFEGNDEGMALIQTSDQGFLITGVLDVTASGGEGNTNRSGQRHAGGDYWAIKTDASGQLVWSKFYGGNFTDTPEGLIQLADGGYIIVGGSDSEDTDISNNLGTYDFWVIRISSAGELLWERSYGGSEIDEARGIVASNDGNFFVVGDTRSSDVMISTNKGAADIWLIKIAPDGTLLWETSFGGSNFDAARDIHKVSDGLLLTGSSRSSDLDVSENKGQNDVWILKVNFEGALQWETTIGGSNIDVGYGITQLNDGTIITVGDTSSNDGDIISNKGFTDLILVQIDD